MVSKESDIDRTKDKEANGEKDGDNGTLHGLRTVTFEKTADGFGFTLRHFVVYPPDTVKAAHLAGKHPTYVDPTWDQNKTEAMDTIFVREVKPGSPAEKAGLVTGDRIVSINSQPVTGKSYQQVIDLIHESGPSLELLVVPKEDDILQLYFASSAYQPVRRVPPPFPLWSSNIGAAPPRLGASEPVSPVRGPIHYRPVDPARRIFFGLDPDPQSQPTSPYYHTVTGASGATPTPRMPPSTSVPAHLSGPLHTVALASEQPKALSGEEVPWQSHSQADSGIGSVEDGEAKAKGTSGGSHQQEPSSLNLVAQRLHLFESGGLLARSLERMKLYRSELSRMSSGCPVPIVSVRAAKFQELDHGSSLPKPAKEEDSATSELKTANSSTLSATPSGHLDRLLPLSSPTSRVPSFDRSPDSPTHEDDPAYSSLPDQSVLTSFSGGATDDADSGAQKEDCMSRSSDDADAVIYRKRNDCKEDKKYHLGRRISYLRATANERQLESEQSEDEQHSVYSTSSSASGSHRIQRLKAFFGEKSSNNAQQPYELKNGSGSDPEIRGDVQGWLACKVVMVDGKRSSDRSWRPVWVVLRGDKVYILKDRKTIDFGEGSQLSLKTSMSDVARDYTKRKHVFRLRMGSGTEYLFQADNHSNMMHWVDALRQITNEDSEVEDILSSEKSVLEKAAVYEQCASSGGRLSPMPVARPVKKLAFRHRSPTSGSPKVKSRRASLGGHGGCRVVLSDEPSLKAATMWRGKVVHSWKKFHGSLASLPPKGHSMGVPLSDCPPSLDNQYVPWLVSLCTRVVEAKGLETVGVYRIPGNSAAVAALSQAVASQGLEALDLGDPRWGDVHVVSSLLKAFLRQLPDPLVASLYPRFVAAAKLPNATSRLAALRALVHELPVHNFETLKFLMQHLKKVVAHSTTNKMEARNLAIVFGPTLVRTADNSMVTMITDMSHQCHITETLINYADFIFSEPEGNGCSSLPEIPLDVNTAPLSDTDSSVLLDNLHKVGGVSQGTTQEVCTKDLVSSLMNAANRKLRQRKFSLSAEQGHHHVGAALKPGSRVKDKIMAFECKSVDDSPKKSTVVEPEVTSSSYPPSPTRPVTSSPERLAATTSAEAVSSRDCSERSTELRPCTYVQLSAMAQQKVRRLEEEMRAQLRASQQRRLQLPSTSWRHWSPTAGGAPGTEGQSTGKMSPSVTVSGATREQIEREWQRAKQELEQDDLLDFMADDPSAFLLARRPVVQSFGRVQDQKPSPTICTPDPSYDASSRFSDTIHFRRDTLGKLTEESGSSETFQPRDGSSQHEKENIPQSSSHPVSETSSVTFRCKKQCISGMSRYAIYRVTDDENGTVRLTCPQADRPQRRSENGVVASLASSILAEHGDSEAQKPSAGNAATVVTQRVTRRPLCLVGLQRRHTIGSSRDVKFHPFPTVRRLPSGQRIDSVGHFYHVGNGGRVASPV